MNYAIIGCGLIGKKRLAGMPAGSQLVVACDTNLSRAEELVKLAKEAKPLNEAVKKAKDVANPQQKWDQLIDELIKTSEHLGEVASKPNTTFQQAKDAFGAVKKVCTDCHKDFRVDDDGKF